MTIRIISSIVVLLSILLLPYWIYVPLLVVAIIMFPFFWEGILYGFLIEILYGGSTTALALLSSPFAILALVLILILPPIRARIRSNV